MNQHVIDLSIRLNTDREATDATSRHTQYTDGGTKVKRSAKVEDPPKWNANPDLDKISFESWMRQLKNKLRGNKDWYPTDELRCTYIEGRLAGNASNDFLPYVDENNHNRLTTSEQMIDHLTLSYSNPNRKKDAVKEWDQLRMIEPKTYKGTRISYIDFKNTFVRLAAELAKPGDTWKEEFHRRLTPALQKSLARDLIDEEESYERTTKMGQILDYTNVQADADNRARRDANGGQTRGGRTQNGSAAPTSTNNRNGNSNGRFAPSTGPNPITRTGMAAHANKLPKEEFERLLREGRCLICKEKGHLLRECLKRTTDNNRAVNEVNAARNARIQALSAKFYDAAPQSNREKLLEDDDRVTDVSEN